MDSLPRNSRLYQYTISANTGLHVIYDHQEQNEILKYIVSVVGEEKRRLCVGAEWKRHFDEATRRRQFVEATRRRKQMAWHIELVALDLYSGKYRTLKLVVSNEKKVSRKMKHNTIATSFIFKFSKTRK